MPSTTSCDAYWQQINEFTERMLHAAKTEAWEELAFIEEKRRIMLYTSLPPLPNDDTTRTAIRHLIQQVINIDQHIITLCQNGQRQIAEQLQALRLGDRARRAYAEF